MNSQEFQTNALRTESIPKEFNVSYEATVCTMSIAVTAGAVVDDIKKAMFYGKPINAERFLDQLRDLNELAEEMRLRVRGDMIYARAPVAVHLEHVKDIRVLHGALGMFTESAEMLNAVRAYALGSVGEELRGGEFDIVNFCEEMGDSDWYKAILHDALDISEEQIRATVIAKLRKRYGDKFTAEAAINRDLAGERAILEGVDQNKPVEYSLEIQDGSLAGTAEVTR